MHKNLLKHIVNYSTRKNIHPFAIFSKISINQHSNNISNKYFSSIHKPNIEFKNDSIDKPIIESKNDPIIELKNDPIIESKNDPIIELKNDPIIESQNEPLFYKLNILKNSVVTTNPITFNPINSKSDHVGSNNYDYLNDGGPGILNIINSILGILLCVATCLIIDQISNHHKTTWEDIELMEKKKNPNVILVKFDEEHK
jgi:hypothetical protein